MRGVPLGYMLLGGVLLAAGPALILFGLPPAWILYPGLVLWTLMAPFDLRDAVRGGRGRIWRELPKLGLLAFAWWRGPQWLATESQLGAVVLALIAAMVPGLLLLLYGARRASSDAKSID